MPRAIWSGAISFGLVNVPVKLYSATSPKTVRFHQLNKETGVRIRQKRVDPTTDDEVAYDSIVKGYELAPDKYVVITPEELDSLGPRVTKTIDIEAFVNLVEIDPIYFDHSYYLAPNTGGEKPYRLLLEAMEQSGKIAIGKIVLRTKQQLCALRPSGGVMTLSTMLFGDEVNDPGNLDELDGVQSADASKREVAMAQQLIESLSAEWDPSEYKDDYREQVIALIERKAAGEDIAVQPEAEAPTAVPDLMAALEASLAAVRGDDDADGAADEEKAKPSKPRKRAPAKASNGAASKSSGSRSKAKAKK